MILQSLVKHYEKLLERGEITKPGWSKVEASYAIKLSEDGEYRGILPLEETVQRGKKAVNIPRTFVVPEVTVATSGIRALLLYHNAEYLLGVCLKGKPERTKQCFEASKEKHLEFLGKIDSPVARAICKYFTNWQIPTEFPDAEKYKKSNFVFIVNGVYAHEDSAIKQAWDAQYSKESDAPIMQCLVTGERLPIARIHPSIKRVKDAQQTGAALVSFNSEAYESFGNKKAQAFNAPVSEYAAFAYTTVLNHLIADDAHRKFVGDSTVVFWAETAEPDYGDLFSMMIDPPTEDANEKAAAIMQKLVKGEPIDEKNIDLNVPFYVLGISPNASRLSVRFFLRDSFGNMLSNLREHYHRLEIVKSKLDKREQLPLYLLLKETTNPNSKDDSGSPLLAGSVLRSILIGVPYPVALFTSIMLRVKATQDSDENDKGGSSKRIAKKINRTKAAIIKAYLLKLTNTRIDKEVLSVSLNEESTYIPYVLGRLFSVLENIQEKANPGINATIKDRYFNSACATPSVVFPLLLKLSNSHLRKMEKGASINLKKQVGTLMDKFSSEKFPKRLTLEEQGTFVLGYYHQTQKRYESKKQENQ
ncbi:type I-C CRISPR-associated protein Cas8c/Csd1 [Candidatus Sumerlaeota bacterium]|mgnify:CR=1 FL=1|nr:type I-C CRISPR-associated protein Cas8c/Csd1 [Candidatus Sumerlaeales bacterium]NLD61332.1 type I-C CRISPR-associated protein Cas8c/Csd1 [Candidatus Sumerlaeota bacterium]